MIRKSGEEFEFYVTRQLESFDYYFSTLNNFRINCEKEFRVELKKINERLDKMSTLAEELGVEETTLSEVIPALATELTGLETKLTEKETALKTAIETEQQTETTLAEKNAELSAIKQVKENLAPLVEKAKGLVPVTPTPTPEGGTTPPAETPPAPVQEPTPAPETPVTPTPETPTT